MRGGRGKDRDWSGCDERGELARKWSVLVVCGADMFGRGGVVMEWGDRHGDW